MGASGAEPPPGDRPAAVAAVAARHGVPPAEVALAPEQGAASRVYLLGPELVLKVARPAPGCAADLRKEAAVTAFGHGLGLRTPEVVAYDGAGARLGAPHLVLRRMPGVRPPVPAASARDPWARPYRELGAQLAVLHAAAPPPAGLPDVPVDPGGDPRPGVAQLAADGYLSTEVAGWLTGCFDRLADMLGPSVAPSARQAGGTPPGCLLHGDAAPTNLLVDPGTRALRALLDWGDAAWGDPAAEFAKLPPRAVPYALAGYLAPAGDVPGAGAGEGAGDGAPDPALVRRWAARVLWHHLGWAVPRLAAAPRPAGAHWSAQPGNRLLELLRCYAQGPPDPWRGLLDVPR